MFQREQPQLYQRVPGSLDGGTPSSPSSRGGPDTADRTIRKFGFIICIMASIAAMAAFGKNARQFIASASDSSTLPFRAVHSPEDDPDDSAPWPRLAWLMSFPNSGTSFTMRMVGRVTGLTAATNYGKECVEKDGKNVPLFQDSPGGPFILHPNDREIPDRYVMTKTHCGGRCQTCGPSKYIETPESFLDACLTGGRYIPKTDAGGKDDKKNKSSSSSTTSLKDMEFVNSKYDKKLVQRAIHLIRDPFDNLVSRFHLEQHEKTKQNRTEWLQTYPNTAEGFQSWCGYNDGKSLKDEIKSNLIDDKVRSLFKKIPCHGDFYRYTQWHNLALKVVEDLDLPTLVVHYENYERNYEGAVDTILDFLELPRNNALPKFIAGKRYKNLYFSDKQRLAALELIRYLADEETWELLERYDDTSELEDNMTEKEATKKQ